MSAFKGKAISVHWESMFTRSSFQTPDMIAQHHLLNDVADLIDKGVLRTTMDQTFGTINAANLKRDSGAPSKTPPSELIGRGIVGPVRVEPVDDVVVARYGDELPARGADRVRGLRDLHPGGRRDADDPPDPASLRRRVRQRVLQP